MSPPRLITIQLLILTLFTTLFGLSDSAHAQNTAAAEPNGQAEKTPGQFFIVQEPITDQSVRKLESAAMAYVRKETDKGKAPILIFEFRSRSTADQPASRFGSVLELCQLISRKLTGARLVVGYVPEPLTGYAALAPLACQEVIFGTKATIGQIVPPNTDALTARTARGFAAELATSLGRSSDLYEALIDDRTELLELTTADNQRHYVLKDRYEAFARTKAVAHQQPAWPAGSRRMIDATKARGVLSRLTVDNPQEILTVYRLDESALRPDPTLGVATKGLWINLNGKLDNFKLSYIKRKLGLLTGSNINVVVLEMDIRGDDLVVAAELANQLDKLTNVRKVAYITGKAEGAAVLPMLACDMIFVKPGAKIGDTYLQNLPEGKSKPKVPTQASITAASNDAQRFAKAHGYAQGLAKGLFEPDVTILKVQDLNSGAVVAVDKADVDAEPKRFRQREILKPAGEHWTFDSTLAVSMGLAAVEESADSLITRIGLDQDRLEKIGPSWVDYLIAILNNRLMTGFILTMGLFLMVLEFKLPGIGLPAIGSTICFTLFFWSHYLSGTADQLEILLFAIGLICLALELFVFPGFGIFGLAGVLLTITSIVLASHTFLWPSGASEYREMGQTLIQLLAALAVVVTGIVWVGKNMQKVPFLKGLVLLPSDRPSYHQELDQTIPGDTELNLSHLIGQIGLTTTPLRPTGKARFGDLIVDATAQTGALEHNQSVEVVATRGLRVIVRDVRSPDSRLIERSSDPFQFDEDLFKS